LYARKAVCIDGQGLLLADSQQESNLRFGRGFRRDYVSFAGATIYQNKYRELVLSECTTPKRGQATRARRLTALAALEPRFHVELVGLNRTFEIDSRRVQCSQEALDAPVDRLVGNIVLKEIPQIIGDIGLNAADLSAPSALCKAFDRICLSVCRVLLRQSAQLHDLSEHAAIDATFYERSAASRHYCQRISYRAQKLKVTKLVDTASQAILDVHCSTNREGSDADLAEQIARRNGASCGLLPPIRATTSNRFVKNYAISGADR
jgi:hypothetical protein